MAAGCNATAVIVRRTLILRSTMTTSPHPCPSAAPDDHGIVWPDDGFLNDELRGMPRSIRVKAYGERLANANPHLTAWSPADRWRVGVVLAAHNAQVLLHHALGTNGPSIAVRGRNHRHGSIFDVEWSCGTGQRVDREDLVKILGPLIEPMDPNSSEVKADAFRMTFGGVSKLFFLERTPSPEAMVLHEQALLNRAIEENEGEKPRATSSATPRRRL